MRLRRLRRLHPHELVLAPVPVVGRSRVEVLPLSGVGDGEWGEGTDILRCVHCADSHLPIATRVLCPTQIAGYILIMTKVIVCL